MPSIATQRTLTGPGGIQLVLDRAEVIPDDPGAGTPAVVQSPNGKTTGTYWCACDTGELSCGDELYLLTDPQVRWLDAQAETVDAFLFSEA